MIQRLASLLSLLLVIAMPMFGENSSNQGNLKVDWGKVVAVSRATATALLDASPPMRRGSELSRQIFRALHDLQCDYVRYDPYLAYPKLAVAELEPPKDGKIFWDASFMDPLVSDFMDAVDGRPVSVDFSVIPQWMFKTPKPVPYPDDPNQVVWNYQQGTEFRDPSLREVADYYARLYSWYTKGGFTDAFGLRHESGHHYKFEYWEVLNEIDIEHPMTPESYTAVYDAVAGAIRKVDPQQKFMGLALSGPRWQPEWFEYFLNHKNHKPGIPLDIIAYHFYAVPNPDESFEVQQHTFFDVADCFVNSVRYIQQIRERLSPETKTAVDEVGAMLPNDWAQGKPGYIFEPIPTHFWNLSGALFAYVYGQLARFGVEVVGESALFQFPGFYPSLTMLDWKTGQPNARYWVLKLMRDNFGPGDKMVETSLSIPYVYAQGFVTPNGGRKILLVNKRDRPFQITLQDIQGGRKDYVNQKTGGEHVASSPVVNGRITLEGLEVAVVTVQP